MNRRLAAALGATTGGLALQLLGLCADAVQHALDPGLAARESVFTLTNFSHLLIVAGLALAVSGSGALVLLLVPGRRLRILSAFSLAALATTASAVAVVSSGALGSGAVSHGHTHDDVTSASYPAMAELEAVLAIDGIGGALERLAMLASSDNDVLRVGHDLAHEIGRLGFHHHETAGEAMLQCTQAFESGCYHGVLQEYLGTEPDGDTTGAVELCTTGLPDDTTTIERFQCLHGLGHGLMLNSNHDLAASLETCDALADGWSQSSCYGGVFMENITFGLAILRGEIAGHELASTPLRIDDPHYPCSAVAAKYKVQCYNLQTSAFLGMNDWDFGAAFERCDEATDYRTICYESMGRDVAGYALRDHDAAIELCAEADGAAEHGCLIGVAKNLLGFDWTIDNAVEFCAVVASGARDGCYAAIGVHLSSLGLPADEMRSECDRIPDDYRRTCEIAARIATN